MSRTTNIANGMLSGELPSGALAVAVYRYAKLTQPIHIPTQIAPVHVARAVKGDGWAAAVSFAQSCTDPDVLNKLSRDGRIQVRRAVAANLFSSQEALEYLFSWSMTHFDEEVMTPAAKRLALDWLVVPERFFGTALCSSTWEVIAGRLVLSAPHLIKAMDYHNAKFEVALAPHLAQGPVHGVSLTDLVHKSSDSLHRARLIQAAWKTEHDVTVELAELVANFGGEHLKSIHVLVKAKRSDPIGVDKLIASPTDWHWALAAQLASEPHHFDELCTKPHVNCASWLLNRAKDLSAKQLVDLVATSTALDIKIGDVLYVNDNVALSAPMMVSALRTGGLTSTKRWLFGELSATPTPGQVTELVNNPGKAFEYEQWVGYNPRGEVSDRDRAASALSGSFEALAQCAWVDELAEALGASFWKCCEHDPGAARYLVRRLTQEFGDNERAWDVALGLLDAFDGSIGQLLTITARLGTNRDVNTGQISLA